MRWPPTSANPVSARVVVWPKKPGTWLDERPRALEQPCLFLVSKSSPSFLFFAPVRLPYHVVCSHFPPSASTTRGVRRRRPTRRQRKGTPANVGPRAARFPGKGRRCNSPIGAKRSNSREGEGRLHASFPSRSWEAYQQQGPRRDHADVVVS
ncbi:hypothetical protein M440DRAFT_1267633 [Trichoderma longibrachiatum ATCC 18648]|uniref:Uncharacterized protein n=1 Tax=Trichoderma longibrachiatum ATCC 18648 TaxID=983965 RepID=A0A2T4C0H0_TRILO|nr:hypothetical protein M440DRAFT_1267633 [Trichoderma longibrachiatum ATCC 18648]